MLVGDPLQIAWDEGIAITFGVGFTVTSKLNVPVPGQLVEAGPVEVITYLTRPGEVPVLSSVSLILAPDPGPGMPVIVPPAGVVISEAVHVNVAPAVADVMIYPTAVLLQIVFEATLFTVGLGFTVIVKGTAGPVQLAPPLV
jgi:hypothetical protein